MDTKTKPIEWGSWRGNWKFGSVGGKPIASMFRQGFDEKERIVYVTVGKKRYEKEGMSESEAKLRAQELLDGFVNEIGEVAQ